MTSLKFCERKKKKQILVQLADEQQMSKQQLKGTLEKRAQIFFLKGRAGMPAYEMRKSKA